MEQVTKNNSSHGQDQLLVQNEIGRIRNWRHHGLGMLQGEIDDLTRVHIWDPSLRTIPFEGYRDVHDHRFDLYSTILIGEIEDVRYHVVAAFEGEGDTDAWEIKHAKIQKDAVDTRLERPAERFSTVRTPPESTHLGYVEQARREDEDAQRAIDRFNLRPVTMVSDPLPVSVKPSHGDLPDPKVPEADTRYIGRASIVELSRDVYRAGARYRVLQRMWHTTRVHGFAVTLVRRSNFDTHPARILGKGFTAIVRYIDDHDPAKKTHDDLVASLVDRAVREVRGLR